MICEYCREEFIGSKFHLDNCQQCGAKNAKQETHSERYKQAFEDADLINCVGEINGHNGVEYFTKELYEVTKYYAFMINKK